MKQWFRKNKAAVAILIVGIIFISIGIARNEEGIVLIKAVRICMECIGIG